MNMKLLRWGAVIALAIGLLPLILTIIAGATAHVLGCKLDEGSVHPCFLIGLNIGDVLYTMGMMFWFFFITGPLVAAVVALWVLIEVILAVKRAMGR